MTQGKFIAVMGEAGAGKTSLLMTLNGLIPQFFEGRFAGQVKVSGSFTHQVPIQQMVQKIGLVLQDPETQIFGLTVWEDAAFGPSNLGIPIDEIKKRVDVCLDVVGLSDYSQRSTEFLSGGEKQRLAIAGILTIGPDILALDEPTSELDPVGKEAIFQIVKELQEQQGMTIIMAEHESDKVLEFADQVIVLQEGRIVWEGEPAHLFADEQLVSQYHLRPPGVARIFWDLKNKGCEIGNRCPTTVQELKERLKPLLSRTETDLANIIPSRKPSQSRKTGQPILQVKNLSHIYPNGHQALQQIHLDLYPGEFVAIIGQNGAGKSTLCKHFNRLLSPSIGQVLFNGRDIADRTTSQLANHIGYVFQNPDHQIFSPSVLEEVMYGLKLQGLPLEQQMKKAHEVLAFVGLDTMEDRHPFSLSKGLRQRLAVASVVALEPQVIIIDEPTTGQDWQGAEKMLQLLHRLNKQGHTIVLITHNMQIVTDHVERVVMMGGGTIVKDCLPHEVFDDESILKTCKISPTQMVQIHEFLAGRV